MNVNSDRSMAKNGVRGASRGQRREPEGSPVAVQPGRNAAMNGGKLVGATDRTIRILRHLADAPEPARASHIAAAVGVNLSTAYNILRTLVLHDFVQFDAASRTYAPGLGLIETGRAAAASRGYLGDAQPVLQALANRYGFTVTLFKPERSDRKVLIMVAYGRNAMRIQMMLGQRMPLLAGSSGKIFAAFSGLGQAEISKQFHAIRWDHPPLFAEFLREVEEAKERRWAVDRGNLAEGAVLVSVPVLDRAGQIQAALTANMFAGQFRTEDAEKLVQDLNEGASQISRLSEL